MPAVIGWFDYELASGGLLAPRLSHDQGKDSTVINGPAFWVQLKPSCCTVHTGEDTITVVTGAPRDREMQAVTAADVALIMKTSAGNNHGAALGSAPRSICDRPHRPDARRCDARD